MFDSPAIFLMVALALLGAVLYFVGREIWRGVAEARAEFKAQKRQQPSSGPEVEPEPQPEPEEPGASARGRDRGCELRPWHEVLGVPSNASLAEIKVAYRRCIARYHPDRVADLGEELRELAEKHAKEINQAYALACKLRV